jgi:hypothetical protein
LLNRSPIARRIGDDTPTPFDTERRAIRGANLAETKVKSKKGKTTKARASGTKAKPEARIPLKKICGDLGWEPKAARVKLRRAWRREGEDNVSFHTKGARWDLTPREAKEVREILGTHA